MAKRLHPRGLSAGPDGGGRSLTYAQLGERVNRLVHAFAAKGVRRGDRIAVLPRNRLEYPELQLATARLGVLLPAGIGGSRGRSEGGALCARGRVPAQHQRQGSAPQAGSAPAGAASPASASADCPGEA